MNEYVTKHKDIICPRIFFHLVEQVKPTFLELIFYSMSVTMDNPMNFNLNL